MGRVQSVRVESSQWAFRQCKRVSLKMSHSTYSVSYYQSCLSVLFISLVDQSCSSVLFISLVHQSCLSVLFISLVISLVYQSYGSGGTAVEGPVGSSINDTAYHAVAERSVYDLNV